VAGRRSVAVARLLSAFTDVIGPVLLVAAAGYGLGRRRIVEAQALTSLSVAVLVPSLAFYALTTSTLPQAALARFAGYILLQFVLIGIVILLAARASGWDRTLTTGLLLATLFSNAGNAGLPLAFFAWGSAGLGAAVGFFAVQAVATNVLAAYLAARAGGGAVHAARALLRLPVTYAIAAGLLLNVLGVPLPPPAARAVQLLANGAVAVMLLLVGVQLAEVHLGGEWGGIAFATATRLVVAPLLAWATAPLVGLDGVARQTGILQASLPTAVTAAIWASEFAVVPTVVSGAVVVTTLLSPLTVTVLLALLR
jgi:predicted permease